MLHRDASLSLRNETPPQFAPRLSSACSSPILAIREVALELRPSFLRPELHLFAYVGNTADGTFHYRSCQTRPVGTTPSARDRRVCAPIPRGRNLGAQFGWRLCVDSRCHFESDRRAHCGGIRALCARFFAGRKPRVCAAAGSNDVVAIDSATRQIIARGRAGHRPWIARVSPDGKILLVSNRDDATVSLLDGNTLAQIAVIATAPDPEQIAILPDNSKAFVTSGSTNQISVLDLKRKVLVTNLALGGAPDDLDLKPDGGELYITSSSAHGLLIVNTGTNEVGDFLLLGMSPTSAIFAPATQTLYVSDSAAGHVVPVSVDTRQVGRPIQAGESPGTCGITPGGDILLVVDFSSNDLAVIRTKTLPPGPAGLSPPRPPTALIPVGSHPRDLAIKVF